MNHLDAILQALGGSRASDNEIMVHCCAHDDPNPSLSITAKDGKLLVKCFAGCEQSSVIEALKTRGLWPESAPKQDAPDGIPATWRGKPLTQRWTYRAENNTVLGYVARYDGPDGKDVVPFFKRDGGKWASGAAPVPRPLYGLDELPSFDGDILIVEGEKAADAAQILAANAVALTWPGGSNAVKKADWSSMRGKNVLVWPDADEPGLKAARDVESMCREVGATSVRTLIPPAGKPKGWDAADAVNEGWTKETFMAWLATPEDSGQAEAQASRFQLLNRDGIMALSDPEWIIKLIFPTRGLVVIHGLSTVGKSFLAFDMGCHIAEGRKFFGHKVKHRPVVYVCLEGEAGFKRRVQAWEQYHGRIIPDQLFLVKDAFDIRLPQDIDGLTAIIPDGAVVIIDTLNRCAPGAEENGSVDMGLIINGAKEIERRTSGLVAFVAHPGKDETRGIRGHSSLFAALDGNIEVVAKGDRFMWTARKVKDGPGGGEYFFKRDVVTLGEDEDGDPITSCVIVPDFAPSQKERRLSPGMKLGLETFMAALGDTEGEAGVHLDTWREHFYCASTADTSEAKKRAFLRSRKDLVEAGILAVINDFYILNEPNRDTGHCRDKTGTLSRQGGFLPGQPGHHPKGCVPCPAPHGDRTGTFVEVTI